MKDLKEKLTEDEMDIVMRARNAHTNNKAKNSTQEEYNLATQFEALVGYWHLNNEQTKLDAMFNEFVKVRL
jgi:ribonuclease-3 family protein